ncbi:MAG TPA: hypothetical protein DCX79_19055, partial [Planctomycetaceae bacterium]|nr:hypothetical protein [Planctomycetaceae bacterium]
MFSGIPTMDDPTQAGLENQLRQLSQLLESAAVCTRRLQQVWHELSDARQHDSDTQHQLQL